MKKVVNPSKPLVHLNSSAHQSRAHRWPPLAAAAALGGEGDDDGMGMTRLFLATLCS